MAKVLDPDFAEGAKKLAKGSVNSVINVSKRHPTVPIGIGAYTMGVKHGIQTHNQSTYGDTYSKGRAENRHPGSYNGQ